MVIEKVYEEHISEAKKNMERFTKSALTIVFFNGTSILLLSELSRIGRNVDEVLANVRLCKEKHVNLFSERKVSASSKMTARRTRF